MNTFSLVQVIFKKCAPFWKGEHCLMSEQPWLKPLQMLVALLGPISKVGLKKMLVVVGGCCFNNQ